MKLHCYDTSLLRLHKMYPGMLRTDKSQWSGLIVLNTPVPSVSFHGNGMHLNHKLIHFKANGIEVSVYRPSIFKMWCGFCSLFIIWIIFIIWSENIMKSICVPACGTLTLVQCPKSRQNSVKPWFKNHAVIHTPLSLFWEFQNDVEQMATVRRWCGWPHIEDFAFKKCVNAVQMM